MTESAYIHIPFCKKKCNYCDFVSYPAIELKDKYIDALLKEIKAFYKGEMLNTLYLGGGTPSLCNVGDFEKILRPFYFDKNTEITVEINPESATGDLLEGLYHLGVNRLSVGIQSFDDEILQKIGRLHNSMQAQKIVQIAKNIGFKNINIDLIYGLPNQSQIMFENSLEKAFELDISHISLYGLKLEKGCYFYKNRPKNLPSDDEQADYYLKAIELCKQNGFERYEVSNFSKKGFNSRHNLNYWNNKNYYGFGVAAGGYEEDVRYYNETDLKKYIENPFDKLKKEVLTSKQKLEEEIFLGFRKAEGIDVDKINNLYNVDFEKMFEKPLKKYAGMYILKTDSGYKLSIKGVLVSNVILSEFL